LRGLSGIGSDGWQHQSLWLDRWVGGWRFTTHFSPLKAVINGLKPVVFGPVAVLREEKRYEHWAHIAHSTLHGI